MSHTPPVFQPAPAGTPPPPPPCEIQVLRRSPAVDKEKSTPGQQDLSWTFGKEGQHGAVLKAPPRATVVAYDASHWEDIDLEGQGDERPQAAGKEAKGSCFQQVLELDTAQCTPGLRDSSSLSTSCSVGCCHSTVIACIVGWQNVVEVMYSPSWSTFSELYLDCMTSCSAG
jgi:hypothetical protein